MTGIITKEYVHTVVKERRVDIHKGDCGRILVIAGKKGMAGAAVLAALGAYRSGSGLVSVSISEELFPIVQIGVKEATCIPRSGSLGDLSRFDAIGIGPGLGVDEENVRIIEHILKDFSGTCVFDADALNTVAEYDMSGLMKKAAGDVIITPHVGEALRLLGINRSEFESIGREGAAKLLSEKFSAVTVLKGAGTIVTSKTGESYINSTGNAGMATGGSGDVLTGIITGLAGQGLMPEDSAKAGVFIHGLAGDMGAEAFSQHGLMAGDIAEFTARAIKEIVGK